MNEPDNEVIEMINRLLKAEDDFIAKITKSNNRCRTHMSQMATWYGCLHGATVVAMLSLQYMDKLPAAFSVAAIILSHLSSYFCIKSSERTWEALIINGEKTILSAMDRKKDWEDFLKEYRGY